MEFDACFRDGHRFEDTGETFGGKPVLSMIFLKYANDRFDEHRAQMKANGQEAFLEMMPFYTKDNVFYIPECARWAYIMENEIRKGCKAPICLILEMQTRDSERR